jgi:hypothetical protein
VGFLLVCAVIAVIMIATRINARSRSRPGYPVPRLLGGPKGRRLIVVDTPEGGRKVIESPPAAPPQQPTRRSGAATRGQTMAQATAPPQAQVPAQPAPAPQAPQPTSAAPVEVEAVRAGEPLEPPSPLDMLSPKIAHVPPELAATVVTLMNKRQEVSAVRLLCDELRIGILDAQKTARSLVGR